LGIGDSFLREVKRPGHKADHLPHLKVKYEWSCNSTPPYVFMGGTYLGSGTILPSPLPWDRVLQKLIVAHILNICPAFYGTQRFITVFGGIRQWTLC